MQPPSPLVTVIGRSSLNCARKPRPPAIWCKTLGWLRWPSNQVVNGSRPIATLLASLGFTAALLGSPALAEPAQPVIHLHLSTDKTVYKSGEAVFLSTHFHNSADTDRVIQVSGMPNAPAVGRQFKLAPLYSIDMLTITREVGAVVEQVVFMPVAANAFSLGGRSVIKPGEQYHETAQLNTEFWGSDSERKQRADKFMRTPGVYTLQAFYRSRSLDPEIRQKLRIFFEGEHMRKSESKRGDAFFAQRIEGLSYHDAEKFRPWDWDFWDGELTTTPITLKVKP
jgi:hypothetical protein